MRTIGRNYSRALLALSEAAMLAALFVLAWQRNWPLELSGFDVAGVPFEHNLPTARLVELYAVAAIGLYALAGWPGLSRLRRGPPRLFALALGALLALAALSPLWAAHGGLAAAQAGHMLVWMLFALMLACRPLSVPHIAVAILGGLLAHVAVGYLQVALQHFVGLGPRFGEVPVEPAQHWASVVFAGPVRLLRAYGLAGHPNVLGGHVGIGLILAFGLVLEWPRVWRALIVVAWAMAWALLLLTFSRSAWLAFATGGLATAILLWRGRRLNRRLAMAGLTLAAVGAAVTIGFVSIFSPFLVGRLDVSTQSYEAFSISERQDMIDVALRLIGDYPLTGVGAANFGVAVRARLGYPLDWVHNVPLLVASELGLPGLAAFLAMLGALAAPGWARWREQKIGLWPALVGGGLVALATIMLFDHYLWTAPQGTLLWATLAGAWMSEAEM